MAGVDSNYSWDELMQFRAAKPFRPFFFEMRTGQLVEVFDALAFGGANDLLGVGDPRFGLRRFRRSDVIGIRLMSEEEIAERSSLITTMQRRRA